VTGYASAPTAFSGGSLQNGVFTAPTSGGTITLSPLTPGSQTSVTGQTPIGAVTGTAFLSSDSSFFYASLTTTDSTKIALVQGGIPFTSAATSVASPNQVLAFNVQPDPALGSNIPFIRAATGGNLPGAAISPFYVVTPSGTLAQDPAGLTTARSLQASLAISGAGSSQQSVVVTNIGLFSGATPQLTAALRGTSLMSSTGTPVLLTSSFGSLADGVGGGLYGSSGLTGIALGANAPFVSETPLSGSPIAYNFNQPAIRTTPAAGGAVTGFIPASGYFGGLVTPSVGSQYSVIGTTSFSQTGATFSAGFNSTQTSTLSPYGLVLGFGGSPSGTPNSTIIDSNVYGATESSGTATLSDSSGGSQSGSQELYLLSSAAAPPPTSLLSGGTLCSSCAFTQWGYWGGNVTSDFQSSGRVDSAHLNFWVAGQVTPSVQIPFSGTGTYNGNMIGTVNNNGSQYVATGNFTNSFNFGASGCGGPGCGTFTINTFDGKTGISAPIGPLSGSTYQGFLGASGIAGRVNGAFFGPNTPGIPPETAGNFTLQNSGGTPYLAAGVFAGHNP
jgi:hypothetical protein